MQNHGLIKPFLFHTRATLILTSLGLWPHNAFVKQGLIQFVLISTNKTWWCTPLWVISSFRADSRFVPSQWETALLCNDVSHWLGTSLDWAIISGPLCRDFLQAVMCNFQAFLVLAPTVLLKERLTHWSLWDVAVISKVYLLKSSNRIVAWTFAVKLLSVDYHRTSLMRSQHRFQ